MKAMEAQIEEVKKENHKLKKDNEGLKREMDLRGGMASEVKIREFES